MINIPMEVGAQAPAGMTGPINGYLSCVSYVRQDLKLLHSGK